MSRLSEQLRVDKEKEYEMLEKEKDYAQRTANSSKCTSSSSNKSKLVRHESR